MKALLLLFFVSSVFAQDTGADLARAFNKRDVPALLRLVDADAVGRHVVRDMGLNARDEESVRANMDKAVRANFDVTLRTLDKTQGDARFMRNGTRDGRNFALVRFDLGEQGIDYVEFYLLPSHRIEDWYVHAAATRFSASTRQNLATMMKTDSMLYGLFGARTGTKADERPFTELRGYLQAQDFVKAYRVLEEFPEGYRKSRQWAVMRVSYGARAGDGYHRTALRHLAASFGADPDLQFMLIDHYFFEKQFDRALLALGALEKAIGGEDGATQNLRGSLLLSMKRFPEAERACRRGMAVEPDLKAPYWCLVSVALASQNGKLAVGSLQIYEKAFAVRFDPDKLAKEEEYREIAKTPEYGAWARSRRGK